MLYICNYKTNNMKTKKVIQRNLPLDGQYKFVSAKYISIIDGGGCSCENCGKLISNMVTIEDANKKQFTVGSDCAETLQSLKSDLNYFQNKNSFEEGKQMRAKIQRHIKKQVGDRWDIVDFHVYTNKVNEKFLVCARKDGGSGMTQIYYPEITIAYIKDLLTA